MMGIPFHADVLGNVVYRLSKTSVEAMENTLCPSEQIRRLCGFLITGFFAGRSGDGGMSKWRWVGSSTAPGIE